MSESERVASMQVRSDVLLVNLRLQLIGNKDHDDVGFFGSLVLEHDLQASLFSLSPALGAFAQTNANVDARVHEVERMGMALRAITDNRNLLTLDDFGVHVIFVIDSNSHEFLLFFDCIQQLCKGLARGGACMAQFRTSRTALNVPFVRAQDCLSTLHVPPRAKPGWTDRSSKNDLANPSNSSTWRFCRFERAASDRRLGRGPPSPRACFRHPSPRS